MKIKVQLSGSEKTLTIATVWSLLLTFLTLVFVGALIYKITPANIAMKIPAPNLPNGQREVMVRAVATTGNHDVLYVGKTNAVIENGMLSATWDPPTEYASVGYIIEVCTNAVNALSDNCYSADQTTLKTGSGKVAGKSTTTETLTSCPYYVSETRTHKLAHLLGLSSVDLQSKVYCGQSATTNSDEFTTFSKIDVIKATDPTGMSYPDGVLVAKDGTLSTLSYDQLFTLLGDEDQTAPVVQPDASGTDSQTLSLSGNILSISGGNSVDLTPAPLSLSSTTSTGLLSSTDWNTFAGKENSLTFDSSFVRTGDSISLMSCAANEVIKSDGVSWLCAQDIVGAPSTTYVAGLGLSLVSTTFNNTGLLGLTASGALAASAGQNPAISLATSSDFTQLASQLALSATGVTAGTYNNVSVDAKGRVTSGTNISYLTTEQDGVIGNEVAGVVTGGGLVMTGSGTSGDPYKLGLVTTCGSGQIMKWNGSAWACASDIDTNTDQQTLSFNPGTGDLSLVNGGTVNLSSINTDSQTLSVSGSGLLRQLTVSGGNTVGLADSDNQSLSLASNTLSLSNGGSVNLAPYLDNTDSQSLSIAGNVISLTNGGSITLPADQNTTYSAGNGLSLGGTVFAINAPTCAGTTKLQWNGSAFVCATDVDTDTDAQTLSWNGGTRTLSILSGNSVVISDADTTYSAGTGITLTGTTFSLTNDFGASIDSSEITNGTIVATDLANSGATAGTYGDTGVNVTQLSVNAQGQVTSVSNRALPTANTTTTGVLNSGDWNTFNGKENVLTFADGLNRSGNSVSLMDCAASQILQRNGGDTAWVCANQVVDTNTTYSAGTGISLVGTTFSNSGVLGVTASGALASSGGQNPAITMATSADFNQLANQLSLTTTGVGAGTYNNVTVDTRGRVTSGSNISYLTSESDGVVGNEVADVVTNGGLVMTGAGTSGDPYKVGMITTCADNQLLKYTSAGGWACASDIDTDTNTDAQTLTWNTGTNNLSISGGNSVNLSSLLDNTDSQTLSWNGGTRTLSLTGGGSVVISDTDTTYSAGDGLSLTGTVFAINAPTCAGTTKLQWNGSAFVCAADVDTDTDAQTLSWNGGTRTLSIVGGNSVVVPDADTTYSAGTGITLTGTTFSLTNDFGSSIDSSEITNGTIAAADLANTGATAGTYGDTGVNVTQLTVNAQGQVTSISSRALPTANTTTTGVLSSGDWNTFNGKENVLTFSDGLVRSSNTITLMDCAASQILQRNGGDTAWVCANQVVDTNTTYSAGTGLSLVGTTFSNAGVLSVSASGALTSSGGQNPAITLATTSDLTQLGSQLGLSDSGVTAGTYNNVTVDAKGRVTSGSNISYLTAESDGVIGNEVADVIVNGGLVMTGAGTGVSPYKVGLITTCSDNQLLKYTSVGGWACANDVDTDTNTDAQTLTWNTGTNSLSISGGNSVSLSSLLDNTDSQTLGLAGNTLSLTNGGSVDLSGYLDNTDSQSLSWNGGTRTLSLTSGGSVVISDADTTYSAGTGITLTGTTFSLTNDFGSSIDSSEITNGTITATDLANSGATAGTYGDSGVNVSQLTVNAQGQVTAVSNRALPSANTTTTGVLSSSDWNTFNGKENVLTFSDGLTRATNTVTLMDCAASQIIQRNGGDTAWVCANQVTDTNTTYSAGTGLSLVGTTFSNSGVLSVGASGALTSSGGQNPAITLATTSDLTQLGSQLGLTDSGVTAGSYNNVTVDAKGRVTSGSTISYLTAETDGVIGNEVADVVVNGGLVMTGAGTGVSPYKVGLITTCSDNQLLKYTSGGGWACANDVDTDTNTDAQTLTWNTGTNSLSISGGNSVSLSSLLDNTDSQTLGLAGNTLSLTNGGSVDLSGYLDNTDSQSLSWNGGTRTLSLTNGGSVVISDADTTYSAGTGITLTGTTFSLTNDFGASIDSGEITDGTVATADLATPSASNNATYGDTGVNVANITVNDKGQVVSVANRTLPTANTTTTGVLSSADWNTFNGKENVLTFSDGLSRATNNVTLMDCAANQILQRNSGDTAWACANQVTDTNTTYTNGTGLSLVGTTFSLTNDFGSSIDSSEITNATIAAADLANSGATAGTYGDTGVNIAQLTVNAQGQVTSVSNRALPTANTTTTGVLSSGDWNTFNGKENVLTFSDGLSRATNTVSLMDCAASEILQRNVGDTAWACATQVVDTNTTYSAGTGITLTGTTFSLTNDFGSSIDSSEITNATIAAADLANSGATAGTYGDTGVNVAQLTVNAQGQVTSVSNRALPTANTTTTGVLSSGDWNTFNGKENVLTFTGNGLFSRSGNTITGIAGTVSGQVLKWNGSAWATGTDNDTTYTNGNGLSLSTGTFSVNSPTCAGTTKLQWNGSAFLCSADVDTDTDTTNFNIRANAGASANIASGNTISFVDGTGTSASRSTNDVSFSLTNVGTAGTYGSATAVPVITTDAQGRVTSVTSTPINFPAEVDGVIGNEVTTATTNGGLTRSGSGTGVSPYTLGLLTTCSDQQVLKYTLGTTTWGCANDTDTNTTYTNGTGLSLVGTTFSLTNDFGSSIDSSEITNATIAAADLANSGATAGTYGDTTVNVAQLTVNAQGQVTSVSNRALPTANTTTTGVLSSSDWNTFSGKENVLTFTGNGLFSRSTNTVTGLACTGSQIAKWNGTSFACGTDVDTNTTYTNGTGITLVGTTFSLTNDFGSSIDSSEITNATVAAADLANSGATAGTYGDTGVNVAQLTVNAQGQVTSVSNRALPTANTTTTGVLSSGDWNTFNGKENVLTFNGPLSRSTNTISLTACGSGQVYQYNGSAWVCTTPGGTTYSAGAGLTLTSTTFSVDCTTTPVAFCNGGDTFGAASVLGTNDANSLSFETNNATAATFSSTGEFLLKDPSDNAISFQVQDSAALPIFTVDTVNNLLLVGSSTTDANAIQLVLDSYNTSTDPSGTNGAMYYNSALAKFRCYQNSMWNDCGNGFNTLTKAADQIATANSTTFQNDNTLVFAASANTTYVFDAWIPVNDSNTAADLKYTFTTPTGATQNILTSYYSSATAFTQCNIITSGQTCANTTVNRADHFIQVKGVVYVAGTAGNVQFQFAQNTATAAVSSPTIKKGATLSWHRSN